MSTKRFSDPNSQPPWKWLLLATFIIIAMSSAKEFLFAGSGVDLVVEHRISKAGTHYLLLEPNSPLELSFEIQRPRQSEAEILACIPAAFSSKKGGISGLYAYKGEAFNLASMDRAISGAIEFSNGKIKIFDTNRGANINEEFLAKLKQNKSSMFQQFQLVKDGQAEGFHDKTRYQRRCIATMGDGKEAIIESDESITMTDFAKDLVELGVANAVYTDMGPWDEGWYKEPRTGKVRVIGNDRLLTGRQTNWVVFRKLGRQ